MNTIELDSRRDLVLCRDDSGRLWVFRQSGQQKHPAALDVADTNDAVVITTRLAGLAPTDLDIEVTDNALTIEAQHEFEEDTEDGTYVVRRRHEPFELSVGLPPEAKPDEIEVSYEDDVLRVRVPKAEERKPRRLAVRYGQMHLEKAAV